MTDEKISCRPHATTTPREVKSCKSLICDGRTVQHAKRCRMLLYITFIKISNNMKTKVYKILFT